VRGTRRGPPPRLLVHGAQRRGGTSLSTLILDLIYSLLDPRIQARSEVASAVKGCDRLDAHRIKRLGSKRVQVARPCATLTNETGALQDVQVMADRLLGHGEVMGDLTGGELAAARLP